jgi:mannose-6-phosphate isomerase-like protein (cupin superfamily)
MSCARTPKILSWILVMLCPALAQAQANSKVMHDNAEVRVLDVTLAAQQATPTPDTGKNRVVVYLDSGKLKQSTPSGASKVVEVQPGDVRWVPAAEQLVSENVADGPLQFIEIELKGKEQPKVAVPDLDPIRVDPKHWSLVLENEFVRVARVRFGPMENGVQHQHARNYLVVYINDQAKGKRGKVSLHLNEGTTTHSEGNPLNQSVERIAIELK